MYVLLMENVTTKILALANLNTEEETVNILSVMEFSAMKQVHVLLKVLV